MGGAMIFGVLTALGGCTSSEPKSQKQIFNYPTYNCAELLEEREQWVDSQSYWSSPETLVQHHAEIAEDEKNLLGLLKSVTGWRDSNEPERMANLAKAHILLIDDHIENRSCSQ